MVARNGLGALRSRSRAAPVPRRRSTQIVVVSHAAPLVSDLEKTPQARRIGLEKQYHKDNPFPWLSEVMDMPKEKNFFETRVTEYKTGELDW